MPLSEGQVQVRDLVMGPGTLYDLQADFNPLVHQVRANQGGPRAWNHGSWSAAEWQEEVDVPIRMIVNGADRDKPSWLAANQAGAAAFAAIGDLGEQVELRFNIGGGEYLMFGRPRLWEPDLDTIDVGYAYTRAGFTAQDPRIYAGTESTAQTGLPVQSGGFTVPLTVPFTVDGVLSGGRADMVNEGRTATGLQVRIDGPVARPTVVVQQPTGEVQRIRFQLDLGVNQWLDVDTAARVALLNGLPQANQRGRAIWDIDPYPLLPGSSVLRYLAGSFNETTEITATWRSAWW